MKLQTALENVAKCFVAPDIIDPRKLNDSLTLQLSMTVIEQAVSKKLITMEQSIKAIKGEEHGIVYS